MSANDGQNLSAHNWYKNNPFNVLRQDLMSCVVIYSNLFYRSSGLRYLLIPEDYLPIAYVSIQCSGSGVCEWDGACHGES